KATAAANRRTTMPASPANLVRSRRRAARSRPLRPRPCELTFTTDVLLCVAGSVWRSNSSTPGGRFRGPGQDDPPHLKPTPDPDTTLTTPPPHKAFSRSQPSQDSPYACLRPRRRRASPLDLRRPASLRGGLVA